MSAMSDLGYGYDPAAEEAEARREQQARERQAAGRCSYVDHDPGCVPESCPLVDNESVEYEEFLTSPPRPDTDLLIPRYVARRERVIFTAPEGLGKTTLLRQWAVAPACGIHPMTGEALPGGPLRTLLIDGENSVDQVRDELHRLFKPHTVSRYQPGNMRIIVRTGLNFLAQDTRLLIGNAVREHKPDVIAMGPLYRLFDGSVDDSTTAAVASVMDGMTNMRGGAADGAALIIEAHRPQASGDTVIRRPNGSRLWMRWPDFGYDVDSNYGIHPFRLARVATREWPGALRRGGQGEWPWVANFDGSARERINRELAGGEHLATADIAARASCSKETAKEVLKKLEKDGLVDSAQEQSWSPKYWWSR